MEINLATIADIQAIARRESLNSGGKILGVTASAPRYVSVPDDEDENAVLEFVVDVYLLESPSQVVAFISDGAGLKKIENVLVASSSIGDIITDLNTPVEIAKSVTGQLQVVGRAKVALPTLILDEYTLLDLNIEHVSELIQNDDGSWEDAWGTPVARGSIFGATLRPRTSATSTSTTSLSTLGQLNKNNAGATIGLGVNPLQRSIQSVSTVWSIEAQEEIRTTETI